MLVIGPGQQPPSGDNFELVGVRCGSLDVTLTIPKPSEATAYTDVNVINLALNIIGLSYDGPIGVLQGINLVNVDAVAAIYSALAENLPNGELYDLYLSGTGGIVVYKVGANTISVKDTGKVSYSSKPKTAVVLTGMQPIPEIEVLEPISLISNGTGEGVEVYSYGDFHSESGCSSRLYNLFGAISFPPTNFNITSESDIPHILNLEKYQSLLGLVYMLKKPAEMNVTFQDVTLVPVMASIGEIPNTKDISVEIDVPPEEIFSTCGICLPADGVAASTEIYRSDDPILGIESAFIFTTKLVSSSTVITDSAGCDGTGSNTATFGNETYNCYNAMGSTGLFGLTVGSDIMYSITGDSKGYALLAGVPVIHTEWAFKLGDLGFHTEEWTTLPASMSNIKLPATVGILVKVARPSINFTKFTDYIIGYDSDSYDALVREAATEVSLCVVPIVQSAPMAKIAYVVDGKVTVVDPDECKPDTDPRTQQNFLDTPCAQMERDLSGYATIRLYADTNDPTELASKALLVDNFVNKDYTTGSVIVDGDQVLEDALGAEYNGGIINSITWSYDGGTSFTATINYGSPLTTSPSLTYNKTPAQTDGVLSRTGVVIEDAGDGVNYTVFINNLGFYQATSMVIDEIRVGDVVNVSIYNNLQEML